MYRFRCFARLAFWACFCGLPCWVGAATPAPTQRILILNTARQSVATELGKPVRFVVKQLNTRDDWAFLDATMQEENGQPIDYHGTRYAEAAAHGLKSDRFDALLQRQGDGWKVRAYSLGPTDVPWVDWAAKYGAPAALFPASGAP